jgi:hypothetical protein
MDKELIELYTQDELKTKIFVKNKIRYQIITFAKNAFDCKQYLIVYSNIDKTKDFPEYAKWVCPKTYFDTHFTMEK